MSREDINALPDFPGVYEIVHVSGKRYVGSSRGIRERCRKHWESLQRGDHHCHHLRYAWAKYGPDQFAFSPIEITLDDPIIIVAREQVWIDKHARRLYNSRKFADPNSQEFFRTPEGRAVIDAQTRRVKDWWAQAEYRTYECERCGAEFQSRHTGKTVRFCSMNCVAATRRKSGKESDTRTCIMCGKRFTIEQRFRRTRTCSRHCAKRSRSVFKPHDIPFILARVAAGESMAGIAQEYGVDHQAIIGMAKRRTWADIPVDPAIEAALIARFSVPCRPPKNRVSLSDEQVREIRRRIVAGANQTHLAREFGISAQMICNIKAGQVYAYVRSEPEIEAAIAELVANNKWSRRLSPDKVAEIRRQIAAGCMLTRIARDFGVSPNVINSIKQGRQYKGVGELATPAPLPLFPD